MADESSPAAEQPPKKRVSRAPRSANADASAPLNLTREVKETTTTPQSAREITSRLKLDEADAELERWRERCILIAVLASLGTCILASLAVLAFSGQTNLQNWATNAMTSVLSGAFAYFAGRQVRPK